MTRAPAQPPSAPGPASLRRRGGRREPAVWLAAPGAVFFVILVGIPLVIVIWTSFLDIGLSNIAHWATAPFIGFRNWSVLTGPNELGVSVLASVVISLEFSLLSTIISTPIAFFAALSVYHRFRGRGLLRSIYLVPYVIPGFVIALLAQIGFLNTYGPVDKLLSALHIASVNTYWLIGGARSFWAMTFTEIWEVWPFIYLLLLAGLQGIPRDQLEAATVDGAGWWARLRYIVIPQLMGVYALAFALSTLFHFGNFTLPYVLFGATPPASVAVLPLNIYNLAFRGFSFGEASAAAMFNICLLVVPAAVYLGLARARTARRAA